VTFSLRDLDTPLIKKGMAAQLAARRARIAAGEKPLGWKVGMGAPASMQKLGLQAPLVGFLMQRALLPSGSTVSLKGYRKPVVEPEIAVRMAHDLSADATPDAVLTAISEIQPAIELADLDRVPEPDNLDAVLAGDIYQRHVLLGTQTRPGGSVAGLTSCVIRRGAEASRTSDPEALTGKLVDIVAHVANTLAALGEKLSAGDIIITGSITPPLMIEADEIGLRHALDPIGEVSVSFSGN
jgi:2-keto-4-pentenoate hydratase